MDVGGLSGRYVVVVRAIINYELIEFSLNHYRDITLIMKYLTVYC
jgi:hypothetical protein